MKFTLTPTPIEREVHTEDITITENGTYTASSGYDGIGTATVNVPDTPTEIALTGDISYLFYSTSGQQMIEKYGSAFKLTDITRLNSAFYGGSTIDASAVSITTAESKLVPLTNCFQYENYITALPHISTTKASNFYYTFGSCGDLADADEFLTNCTLNNNGTDSTGYAFTGCYALKSVPTTFLNKFYNKATGNNAAYYCAFYYNTVLEALDGWGLDSTITASSNMFLSTVDKCGSLKSFTFVSGKSANWSNQILNFSDCVGWVDSGAVGKRNGHALDSTKRVTDAATYAALKDDYWTTDVAYSRFNKVSAEAMIDSLPDCSAVSTTSNAIKLKTGAGASTDGGSVSDLSETSLATATAKGFTVAYVV